MGACEITQQTRSSSAPSLARVYTALAMAGLLAAGLCVVIPGARELTKSFLQLKLSTNTPTVSAAVSIWFHNLRVLAAPLAVAVIFKPHQSRVARFGWGVWVAAIAIINVVTVAGAVAAYGTKLLPYLPHLPLEFLAVAVSIHAWITATRQQLTRTQILTYACWIPTILAIAATVETCLTP